MNVYSTQGIVDEAQKLGHNMEQIDYTKCAVKLGKSKPRIFYHDDGITHDFDAIIPRIGTKMYGHGVAIVKQFELNGIFSTARSLSITRARKKILIPETLFAINTYTIQEQMELWGGAQVIIKLKEATQGLGVILAKKIRQIIIDTFYNIDTSIHIQKSTWKLMERSFVYLW